MQAFDYYYFYHNNQMKRKSKIGLPPGEVIFTGNQKVEKVNIHYLKYNSESIFDIILSNHAEIKFANDASTVDWYDIRGIHDEELIKAIGSRFDINSLVLADVVDPLQRPILEEYKSGVFLILKSISFDKSKFKIQVEHIGLYFGLDFIITFQEDHSDVFETVRKRIHNNKGLVRSKKADYLAFALIDNILDQQFVVSDLLQEEIERQEDMILEGAKTESKQNIHFLKKEMIKMQKSITPLREALSRLSRTENQFIDKKNRIYFRDLHDMVIQVKDRVENQRDYLNGLQDLLLSEISFKMNEIMKVLTIITTIFVPLSFLAGLYGMNFENMPELKQQNGYYYLLGFMLLLVVAFWVYFKKKKWL